jgi:hypothetical protein
MNTPAAALMEAIGLVVASDTPVLLACGDEPAPENLAGQAPRGRCWRVRSWSVPARPRARLGQIVVARGPMPTLRPDGFSPQAIANPQIGAPGWSTPCCAGHRHGVIPLDSGTGRGFVAEFTPAHR